jgi:hypothetical protein
MMTTPKRPLREELHEAIATLQAIAEGSKPMPHGRNPEVLSPVMVAYQRGKDAARHPRCKPGAPIHAQLREMDRIIRNNEQLRARWMSWFEAHYAVAESDHKKK